jgi:hypothetical protein
MIIKKMPYCRGKLSVLPFRVISEDGKIVRAFATRKEAEKWLNEQRKEQTDVSN